MIDVTSEAREALPRLRFKFHGLSNRKDGKGQKLMNMHWQKGHEINILPFYLYLVSMCFICQYHNHLLTPSPPVQPVPYGSH
jgi:hypothetical protein